MGGLRYASLVEDRTGVDPVGTFDDDGDGLSLYRVANIHYDPRSRCSWVGDVVPSEITPHEEHARQAMKARTGGFPGGFGRDRTFAESALDVCILGNPHAHNFFHWQEEMLKVVLFEEMGFAGHYVLPPGMPGFCFDFLDILGIDRGRVAIAERPTRYAGGWICDHLTLFDIASHPRVIEIARARLLPVEDGESGLGERIWIDRRDAFRAIVNWDEIATILDAAGFAIVDMASLPVRRQLAVASAARVIGGPHGAGLVHAAFMQREGLLIEAFSPDYLYPCLLDVCAALGHDYALLVGRNAPWERYAHRNDVRIEPDQLRAALRRL